MLRIGKWEISFGIEPRATAHLLTRRVGVTRYPGTFGLTLGRASLVISNW